MLGPRRFCQRALLVLMIPCASGANRITSEIWMASSSGSTGGPLSGNQQNDDESHEDVGEVGADRPALQPADAVRGDRQQPDGALVEVPLVDRMDALLVAHLGDEEV